MIYKSKEKGIKRKIWEKSLNFRYVFFQSVFCLLSQWFGSWCFAVKSTVVTLLKISPQIFLSLRYLTVPENVRDEFILSLKQKFRKTLKIEVCNCQQIIADLGTLVFWETVNQKFPSCHSNPFGSQLEALSGVTTSIALCYFSIVILNGR